MTPAELTHALAAPATPLAAGLVGRQLGAEVPYEPAWAAMRSFTDQRNDATPDELWELQHPPVYTLGQAGKREHLLRDIGIPLVPIDRGGQITYHGPGQLIMYLLFDLSRRQLKVRELVHLMEQALINCLNAWGLAAQRMDGAPGVYVPLASGALAKIAALGLRVRRGCSYHGLSLNVDTDLSPFHAINPCGYAGLATTRLIDHGIHLPIDAVADQLRQHLLALLPALQPAASTQTQP